MPDISLQPDAERLQWIASHLRILTKGGALQLLRPNRAQLALHMAMQLQRCPGRNLPVRIRLLKARQLGMSTWVEAEGFYEVHTRPNWRAMAVSVDADSTDHIFGMAKLFDEDLPSHLRRAKDNTNRKEIVYSAPHRSRFVSQTAGKLSLGRSFTAQFLHCSEIGFWENAETQMSGLEDIVPLKPGTTIIQETTANGQGGYFYDGWMEDVRRRRRYPDDYSGYLPVFLPWYMFAEYAVEPPPGIGFSKEEREIQRRFDLTDAQLYWRQLKIAQKNGDLGLFMQEFPALPEEAFQTSGNPVFSADIIARQALYQQEQFRRVLFDETSGKVEMVDTEELMNVWLIHRPPVEDHDYALGVDTMEGRLSDVNNPKSDLDFDEMVILDRNTGEEVAYYRGRGDQRELGKQAYRAAVYYNDAWVGPEIPQGMVLLNYFKEMGYPYVYNRQRHEDRQTETDSEVLGWRTTAITRKWLVDDMIVALKETSIKLVFPDLLDQCRTFVRDKNGRPGHLPGEHDDGLFAAMIALQVHKRCERSGKPSRQTHTGEQAKPAHDDNNLAQVGAVDDWIPGEEENEESEDALTHTY